MIKNRLSVISQQDVETVTKKNQDYGESWCHRGGGQAFAVIWRKVDRIRSIWEKTYGSENPISKEFVELTKTIEEVASRFGYDFFKMWAENPGNIIDDIRDLRQYLLLLEEYCTRNAP